MFLWFSIKVKTCHHSKIEVSTCIYPSQACTSIQLLEAEHHIMMTSNDMPIFFIHVSTLLFPWLQFCLFSSSRFKFSFQSESSKVQGAHAPKGPKAAGTLGFPSGKRLLMSPVSRVVKNHGLQLSSCIKTTRLDIYTYLGPETSMY